MAALHNKRVIQPTVHENPYICYFKGPLCRGSDASAEMEKS